MPLASLADIDRLDGTAANAAHRPPEGAISSVVQILRTELEMAMALTGRTSLSAIDRTVLWQ